jgi:hypothetical protein
MNTKIEEIAKKISDDKEKELLESILNQSTSATTTADVSATTSQPFTFEEIEELITTANKIKKEISDQLYEKLKTKIFIVPSESSKFMLYESLEDEVGARAWDLDVMVSDEADDIIIVNKRWFEDIDLSIIK